MFWAGIFLDFLSKGLPMIISRTPFRLPLGGGGTDLPSYYRAHGGFLVTSAINKYMYININVPAIVNKIKINYTKVEILDPDRIEDIRHDIVRETLKYLGIRFPIEISSMADLSAGTGMGSSSAYAVGLLNGLSRMMRRFISVQELAEEACTVEIDRIGKPIGKQDQYAAAFGGVITLDIDPSGRVKVTPLVLEHEVLLELENRLMMFYTNIEREASEILEEQGRRIQGLGTGGDGKKEAISSQLSAVSQRNKEKGLGTGDLGEKSISNQPSVVSKKEEKQTAMTALEAMHKIKAIGYRVRDTLVAGDIDGFGALLHEHWTTKKLMSDKMSSPKIDAWYKTAMENGALGGKIMGAGGGGFFLFCVKNGSRKKLKKAMESSGLRFMDFKVDFEGSKVVVNI
jgi:D-glycero-alpha-D-manno-heptose-7-phosphate kinase